MRAESISPALGLCGHNFHSRMVWCLTTSSQGRLGTTRSQRVETKRYEGCPGGT